MLPYTSEYERALAEYHAQCSTIEAAILAKQAKIQRLQTQIDGLSARKSKLRCPNWIDAIVRPLADDLAKQTGKYARVLGPFGLRAEVGIYLTDVSDTDLVTGAYDYITLVPEVSGDVIKMHYETGRVIRECVPGSIGEINHCGNETLPLPDTIDEVIGLLQHHECWKERKEHEEHRDKIR